MTPAMARAQRSRKGDPQNMPQAVDGESDLVSIDTTWGKLQRIVPVPGVQTVGELELAELAAAGAMLVDSRLPDSRSGLTIPGAVNISHEQMLERRGELDPDRIAILFCNGPQCPQSPDALRQLVDAGYPAQALAYYRGGMHDWVSLAMPTETVSTQP